LIIKLFEFYIDFLSLFRKMHWAPLQTVL